MLLPLLLALLLDMPCSTEGDEHKILEALRKQPMTAESYGVIVNATLPRQGELFTPTLPDWWSYRKGDDWHAAQAFIAALARADEGTFVVVIFEPPTSFTPLLRTLETMLREMRPTGGKVPYTAFLALAERVDHEASRNPDSCVLAWDAARLLQVHADRRHEREVTSRHDCAAALIDFRAWLREHRRELERGAREERETVAAARAVMDRVELCR